MLTGGESWFEYSYNYYRKWILQNDKSDDFAKPLGKQKKTMITCFFNDHGLQYINNIQQGIKIDASYIVDLVK